ncbi:MAG: branched-chain amino acid ABC transporter permease [Oscillospiraceae bacterium]|nr:branched-chain amino acid ABC transporter permease [Oscillospiraceae bacterium]
MKNMLKNKTTRTDLMTYGLVIVAFLVMQVMYSAGMLGSSVKGFLIPICVYISLAVSLNLLVGICGELSLGHAGFMGIGAFTGIVVAAVLKDVIASDVVRLLLAMVGGGIIAGIASVIIGIPVLRLRGDYLAIVTLAFGEILKNIIGNLYIGKDVNGIHFAFNSTSLILGEGGKKILSGPMGATGVQKIASFPMGFVLVMVTLFVVLNLVNSKEGRAIKAVRDNRIAAESVGINVTGFRLKAFVVSAFLAGMAGALYGLNYSSLTASKFNFNTSINILVFVVLGGMGNIMGSVISAAVLYVLPEAMRSLEDYRMILYAIVLILVMLFTWSPKFKEFVSVAKAKVIGLVKKEEVGTNE